MTKNSATEKMEPLKRALTVFQENENGEKRKGVVEEMKHLVAMLRESLGEIDEETLKDANGTRALYEELSRASHVFVGLEAALQWLVEVFDRKQNVDVTLSFEGERKHVDHCMGYFVFQCVQQLLEGAALRGDDGPFEVVLGDSNEGDMVAVAVVERGLAIEGEEEEYAKRFGFTHLFDRVRSVGGHVSVRARKEEGTRVTILVPPVLKKH